MRALFCGKHIVIEEMKACRANLFEEKYHQKTPVILNLFQDNRRHTRVILKQVQDDEKTVILIYVLHAEPQFN